MATTAENPGTVIGFSVSVGADPNLQKKEKKTHTVCNIIQTPEHHFHMGYCVWRTITNYTIFYRVQINNEFVKDTQQTQT